MEVWVNPALPAENNSSIRLHGYGIGIIVSLGEVGEGDTAIAKSGIKIPGRRPCPMTRKKGHSDDDGCNQKVTWRCHLLSKNFFGVGVVIGFHSSSDLSLIR